MNKQQLITGLSFHNDVADGTNSAASRILNFVLENIQNEVAKGNKVSIAGFGKFYPYTLASGKTVPKFKAYKGFKTRVVA